MSDGAAPSASAPRRAENVRREEISTRRRSQERYFEVQVCEMCGENHSAEGCNGVEKIFRCAICAQRGHEMRECPRNTCHFCNELHDSCYSEKHLHKVYLRNCYRCGGKHFPFLCCNESFKTRTPNCCNCGCAHHLDECMLRMPGGTLYLKRNDRLATQVKMDTAGKPQK